MIEISHYHIFKVYKSNSSHFFSQILRVRPVGEQTKGREAFVKGFYMFNENYVERLDKWNKFCNEPSSLLINYWEIMEY